jgi:UPF0716 protein FxsA
VIFFILLIAFTVIPAVEIGLFVEIGGQIGAMATIMVVLFTGVAGAALARSQGTRVVADVQAALSGGKMPTDELIEGALVVFGGALLLTPGFLTDFLGISCLLPPSRKALSILIKRWAASKVQVVGAGRVNVGDFRVRTGGVRPGPAARETTIDLSGATTPTAATGPRTIDADFEVVDDE